MWPRVAGGIFLVAVCAACSPDGALIDRDLGPIEDVLDTATLALWPGESDGSGGKIIPLVTAFSGGRSVAYWFAGLAPQTTADIFWFCREGDDACPIDGRGAIDFDRTVGDPVFSRMPGEQTYSPYWWVRVIRVSDGYRANSLKSVASIERALLDGSVRNEWYHFDFAGRARPDKAIEHSVMVLSDTVLERNGEPTVGDGLPSEFVAQRSGWHKQYRVTYFDFSHTEGVLAPAFEQQEWILPSMPAAELLVFFRDCDAGSTSETCARPGPMRGAVSERALGRDLTGDGDMGDTNNLVAAWPEDLPLGSDYSPLWVVMEVHVNVQYDLAVALIDQSRDQTLSDLKDSADIAALVAAGWLAQPVPMSEERWPTRVNGNNGLVFLDGPAQVPAR